MRSDRHDGNPDPLGHSVKAEAAAVEIRAHGASWHGSLPSMTGALVLAVALVLPGLAAAQMRTIPEAAKQGTIAHVTDMIVSVDGREMRLAPGATIRNQRNLIIVPVVLPPEGALAQYLVDGNGQISRVWLLTAEEAARKRDASR